MVMLASLSPHGTLRIANKEACVNLLTNPTDICEWSEAVAVGSLSNWETGCDTNNLVLRHSYRLRHRLCHRLCHRLSRFKYRLYRFGYRFTYGLRNGFHYIIDRFFCMGLFKHKEQIELKKYKYLTDDYNPFWYS
jgi:hypothetical protein